MRYAAISTAWLLALVACTSDIKNPDAVVVEETGASIEGASAKTSERVAEPKAAVSALVGSYVGYFEPDGKDVDAFFGVDDAEIGWNRANKINLSIDSIAGDRVFGHSVVAGNDRPFEGGYVPTGTAGHQFVGREPGDDRYDGVFSFSVSENTLTGTWKAFKKINIQERRYELDRKDFSYRADVMLDESNRYVDWRDIKRTKQMGQVDGEVFEWIEQTYATATDKIYEINASTEKLTPARVENLKRGDLLIIRNTIYARHGYSFRERPLRVFFDAQPWYIPVHADITSDFTPLELDNIKLLLRYEQNAAEYYDRFGRG